MKQRFLQYAALAATSALFAPVWAQAIEWPRIGRPAVVVPGGVLEVAARETGTLSLERSGQRIALETNWRATEGAVHHGRVLLPSSLEAGTYALQCDDTNGLSERSGAVQVLPEFPDAYAVAVLCGTPSKGETLRSPIQPVALPNRLAEAKVQLAIVVGPLTQNATNEEYEVLEKALLAAEIPVFLCPDALDLQGDAFQRRFGDPVHGGQFGKDGFLFLGPGLAASDPQANERLGQAHLLRRALRASRWSVATAGSYGLDWDIRAQIALFVDDPLDYLIVGDVAAGLGETVPWGKTVLVSPATSDRGDLTVFSVTESGVEVRQQPEPAETAPEKTP